MDAQVPLTKKAQKKKLKLERLTQLKAERKANRKRKDKEKKERRRSQPAPFKTQGSTKKEDRQRLLTAKQSGVRLVIDLSFRHLMNDKEIASLCRQLTSIYAENKRSSNPFHLYFTSFGGSIKEAFEQFVDTYRNWIVELEEASYLEVFAEERGSIVYLTADAEKNISTETTRDGRAVPFDKECILVIGGLIDRNRHKKICFEAATEQGVKTVQLPLHLLKSGMKTMKVLTTNQCASMLLKYNEHPDWESAVEAVVPKRKQHQPCLHADPLADPSDPSTHSEAIILNEMSDE